MTVLQNILNNPIISICDKNFKICNLCIFEKFNKGFIYVNNLLGNYLFGKLIPISKIF